VSRHFGGAAMRNVAASSRHPDGSRMVHRGTDELPVQQNSVHDGEATPSVQERTQQS
jgi:hypothetical protein